MSGGQPKKLWPKRVKLDLSKTTFFNTRPEIKTGHTRKGWIIAPELSY